MKEKITNLLKVKTIITLMVLMVFCILALKRVVPVEQFVSVVMMIITYFFNKDFKESTLEEKEIQENQEVE